MTNYLEQAARLLGEVEQAEAKANANYPAILAARRLELAREWAKLAAIDKGIAFPADPGEDGQPS